MPSTPTDASEVSILNRLLRPEVPTFSPEGAQDILSLGFPESDKERMRELSAKARAGTLTAEEDAEAGRYELLGHLLLDASWGGRREPVAEFGSATLGG